MMNLEKEIIDTKSIYNKLRQTIYNTNISYGPVSSLHYNFNMGLLYLLLRTTIRSLVTKDDLYEDQL